MKRIPFTRFLVTTEAEIQEIGTTVGLRAAEFQHKADSAYVKIVADAYEEQVRVLVTVSERMAEFIGSIEGDEDFLARRDELVAAISEFTA